MKRGRQELASFFTTSNRNEEGKLHCLDGPAIEWDDGHKEWWIDGKLHRLDGPAIEDPRNNGDRWFIDYKELTQQQFERHPLVIFHRLSKAR